MGQLNPIGVRLAHGSEYFVESLFLEIEHSKQHLVQPHPINTQAFGKHDCSREPAKFLLELS